MKKEIKETKKGIKEMKKYRYDGSEIFPQKIKTCDGYILTKVNDGIYENAFIPEYRNCKGDVCVIPDVEKYEILESKEV